MATNMPVTGSVELVAGERRRARAMPSTLVVAVDARRRREFQQERDLGVGERLVLHDLRRAQLVAAVDDGDLAANFVRKIASSIAESPPPTTAMSCPRKKKPSQVAQVETPWPSRRLLARQAEHQRLGAGGRRSRLGPVGRLGRVGIADPDAERAVREVDPGDLGRCMSSAPKRSACSRILVISSGPMMPSGKPGKFSTSVVSISWPPGWSLVDDGSPSMHQRGEVGAGGVDRGGEPGGPGADDDDVAGSGDAMAADSSWAGQALRRRRKTMAPTSRNTHPRMR